MKACSVSLFCSEGKLDVTRFVLWLDMMYVKRFRLNFLPKVYHLEVNIWVLKYFKFI